MAENKYGFHWGEISGPYLFNWIRDPPTKPAQTTKPKRPRLCAWHSTLSVMLSPFVCDRRIRTSEVPEFPGGTTRPERGWHLECLECMAGRFQCVKIP